MQFDMKIQINYEQAGIPAPAEDAVATVYLLKTSEDMAPMNEKPMVVLCPGGAYWVRAGREAQPVAMRLLAQGIHVMVLHYSVAPSRFPTAALQLAECVRLARMHASEWHVLKNQVYVMGFSAGGHLAGTVGTLWEDEVFRLLPGEPEDIRPDGQILCYPVLTMGEKTEWGTRNNLLGTGHTEEMAQRVSLQKHVSSKTPRTFLWHTTDDGLVPVENSLLYAAALRKNGVSFELHIYEHGPHGLSTSDQVTASIPEFNMPDNKGWVDLAVRFVRRGMEKKADEE